MFNLGGDSHTSQNRLPPAGPPVSPAPRWEPWAVLAILVSIFLINAAVAGRTPTVVNDEPPYVDPAANLYFGSGFVSTLWGQDRHAAWSGNVPLYQASLYVAFKLFGFGLEQGRWWNAILVSLGGFMIWLAVKRGSILQKPSSRLICLLLVLSGAVSTLTFRTLRPDVMMFVVCAAVFLCCTIRPLAIRFPVVMLAAALVPFAGIPILPYVGLVLLFYAVFFGRPAIPTASAIAVGLGAGMAMLGFFYSQLSSLKAFLGIVLPFTALGGSTLSFKERLMAKIFGREPHWPDNLFTCFFGDPRELVSPKTLCDYGALALFGLLIVIVIARRRELDTATRRTALFAVATVLLVPPVMHFMGHYRSYYRWMSYVPLCVCAPLLLERALAVRFSPLLWRFANLTCTAAIAMGVPVRTIDVLASWEARSTKAIEQAAAQVVRPTDVVICNFKVYFAVRPRARLVFATELTATGMFERIIDLPKNDVSLLCLRPGEEGEVVALVGGRWEQVPLSEALASALLKSRYAATFFRRVPSAPN